MEDTYITRKLEDEIRKNLSSREIIAIVGPRQVGKTTLIKHILTTLQGTKFLDFEDRATLELFNNDIDSFAELHIKGNKYVFIDEFQYAQNGGKNLKYLFDRYDTKIIISGSSVIGLAQESLKYLVGRVFIFNLYPFSFEEMLAYRDKRLHDIMKKNQENSEEVNKMLKKHYEEFVLYGGYPRVILARSYEEKETVLKNIYNTYILKEIKGILNIKNEYVLTRLMQALALQIGNIINYQELCSLVGTTYPEIIESLHTLQKTYVTAECRPYYRNKRTELIKAPKSFFIDTGFRNAIIKNFQPLSERPDQGALYENAIATELLKHGYDLRYWRTKAKAEVDFIIEKNNIPIPIESKSSLSGDRIPKSLQSFIEKYKVRKAALIVNNRLSQERKKGLTLLPPWSLSRFLEPSKRK